MLNTNDVYRMIKELSKQYANPRPQILIQQLAAELKTSREYILPYLKELTSMRLIQFENLNMAHVKLTLLGCAVNR